MGLDRILLRPHADRQIVHQGRTVLVTGLDGAIDGGAQGLFQHDTRVLSRHLVALVAPGAPPPTWSGGRLRFALDLPAQGRFVVRLDFSTEIDGRPFRPLYREARFGGQETPRDRWREGFVRQATRLATPHPGIDAMYRRAV